MFGSRIVRLASSFSLLLVLAAAALSADPDRILSDLKGAKSPAEAKRALEKSDWKNLDPDVRASIRQIIESPGATQRQVDQVRQKLELRQIAKRGVSGTSAAEAAREVKSSPLYTDPGIQESSNWLEGAFRRLKDLVPEFETPDAPNVPNPSGLFDFLVPIMWIILGAIIATFAYFVIRHFNWRSKLRRKASAVLEDDEPERTLDEWLALADEHAAAGRYREAVRAMYLSCLLKFDEGKVARFIRGETNWEHLRRIQSSPNLPPGIDFMPPTQAFDRIWYGYHVRGLEDVEEFRAWYQRIVEALRGAKAA